MWNRIVPSLASARQAYLAEELRKVEIAGYQTIHLDIEDGNFIDNITFGFKAIKELRKLTDLPFNIHLMVTNPEKYLQALSDFSPCSVFVHVESCQNISELIFLCQQQSIPMGLAFLPITPLENYQYLLHRCTSLLLMTSEPDGQGQKFIDASWERIENTRKRFPDQEIWVDGDITKARAKRLLELGVDKFVMGREVFKQL